MPCDFRRYPPTWPAISLRIRQRAGWRCECCGAEQGKPHPITGSRVVLTVAHWDNDDPQDCSDGNLKSTCQRCHNRHDAPLRQAHARATRWRKRHAGMGLLPFGEPLPGIDRSPSRARA